MQKEICDLLKNILHIANKIQNFQTWIIQLCYILFWHLHTHQYM